MALNQHQFESIVRQYELLRHDNRLLEEKRRAEVYSRIPEFEELDERIRKSSIQKAGLLLDGDDTALSSLHEVVQEITERKKRLLHDAGFPEDYLEPVYTCPYCRDTGYILTPEQTREKCRCLRRRELTVLYEQSNIQHIISRENFDSLSYNYYRGEDLELFERAVKNCKNFVKNFSTDYRNLFFYGTVGTGKSFLSGCVAAELLKEGHAVIYFSSAGLFDTLARYTFDSKGKDELYGFYEDLYNCELLIIDDLGTEMTNSFVASQLFACLNERHLRRRAVIISTNLSLEELRDRYSDRVFSRITSNYILCKLTGPDIRMAKKCNSHT